MQYLKQYLNTSIQYLQHEILNAFCIMQFCAPVERLFSAYVLQYSCTISNTTITETETARYLHFCFKSLRCKEPMGAKSWIKNKVESSQMSNALSG